MRKGRVVKGPEQPYDGGLGGAAEPPARSAPPPVSWEGLVRILVVEDNSRMSEVLKRGLTEEGYAVDLAASREQAEDLLGQNDYDSLLLDIVLRREDGLDLLKSMRREGRWLPVLVLTARDSVEDRVRGLDSGADDYLVKPFAFPELSARLRALVRRVPAPRPAEIQVGDLCLDPARHEVRRGQTQIHLTAREFSLLEYLMRHPQQVLGRARILEHVWDLAYDRDFNILEVYIGYLREKVDRPFGRRSIVTVRGAGYQLVEDGARANPA
jgi:two-component system OmpR family response regulator